MSSLRYPKINLRGWQPTGLERKIRKEAKRGTRVVLNAFPFPKLKPHKRSGNLFVYVV